MHARSTPSYPVARDRPRKAPGACVTRVAPGNRAMRDVPAMVARPRARRSRPSSDRVRLARGCAGCSHTPLRWTAASRYLSRSFAFERISTRCIRSRPHLQNPGRSSTRGRKRARIRRLPLRLSQRRSSAPRRRHRRRAPADQPVFRFPSARVTHAVRARVSRIARLRAAWNVSIRSTGEFT
ncbi:hypothetical protein Bcep1808_3159 [Burkholderia vietnamiensis G4]|uniref:Uncharacterized protein n=1 Tax=Burkholderia vietnamiensis (strain G4 / LMG 22486) TaxID=269482 RepID=A4JIP7_BURVG|nr:hypothetical protein Bcep1808_3159 [Burkholderia vietnamiensis G4]